VADGGRSPGINAAGPNDWLRDYLLAFRVAVVGRCGKSGGGCPPASARCGYRSGRSNAPVGHLSPALLHILPAASGEYPQSGWAHFLKGRTLTAQGKLQAIEEYRAALAADPTLPEVHIAMADFYLPIPRSKMRWPNAQKELALNASSARPKLG